MSNPRIISVVGLGYVGLPLAVALARHTRVIGFDTNSEHIENLARGIDKNSTVPAAQLDNKNLQFSCDPVSIADADFHIIAVPTPVNASHEPDLHLLHAATSTVARHLKKNDIVVYESTVYPGVTEEECIPILEKNSGLKNGKDFFVGYSPERINPGDELHTLESTIKIVSAQDASTLKIISDTYGLVVKAGLHQVNSIKVAEAAKVIENTQRDINIALMNELALIFEKLGIDTSEVLTAAGTKWNFLNFQPGLVGGHCIGVDPYYLTHKAIQVGYAPRVILSGRAVNDSMGVYVARMVVKQLIKSGIVVKDAIVTILGFTFKENISDVRNTRVIDIVRELESFDIDVQVHDPCANFNEVQHEYRFDLVDREKLKLADAVILAVAHQEYIDGGWTMLQGLLNKTAVIFDVKSVLPLESKPANINFQRL